VKRPITVNNQYETPMMDTDELRRLANDNAKVWKVVDDAVNNPLPLPEVDGSDTEYAGLREWLFTVRHFTPEDRLDLFRQALLSLKEPRAIQLLEGEIRMLSTTTDSGPLDTGSNHLGVYAGAQGPQEPVYTGAPRSVLNPKDPTQLRPIGAVARISEAAAYAAVLSAVAWGAYQFGSGALGALKAAIQTL
jgi:hypothetical protein